MIKVAQEEDFDTVYDMAKKFANASNYKDFVEESNLKTLIYLFLKGDKTDKIVLLNDDKGFLAATVTPFFFGNVKVASEIAWWVNPEERENGVGKELIEAFEFWANKIGCKIITMAALDDSVAKYYEKENYTLYERVYFKEL